ncbi:translation initiation factor eIF3 subunit g [Blyttiomyces sp. JEL0837]|nr:translation initiation factor eIF3 subunit g [Blyttiomyces sp. JEL0837]
MNCSRWSDDVDDQGTLELKLFNLFRREARKVAINDSQHDIYGGLVYKKGFLEGIKFGEDITSPKTHIEPDGTKVVVEYRTNDDGKKVKVGMIMLASGQNSNHNHNSPQLKKVTTKIRTRVVKASVNPAVAHRKALKKFGDSEGNKPGPDSNSTSYGEKVFLKLSSTGKGLEESKEDENLAKKKALVNAKIMCRTCKGDHWTSKCPFRDSHQPMDLAPVESKDPEPSAAGGAGSGGKYVPPSLRNRGPGESSGSGSAPPRRDELPTLRITNLSEDTTEQDVKDLVSRFGHTSRVFVARDKETNMCKGFAFVSFFMKEDADRCMKSLNGYGYDNLILHVEFAKNNRD